MQPEAAVIRKEEGMAFSVSAPAVPAVQPGPTAAVEAGRMAYLCVVQPLDVAGAVPLLEQARRLSQNCRCLVVDLARAEFVDSAGVRALLEIATELESRGRELRLVLKPGSRVERTFKLLCLMQRFQVFPDLKSAWCSQSKPGTS